MTIKPLYLDFFRFLDQEPNGDLWDSYQRIYLQPHEKFLKAYWQNFRHFDLSQIAERVRQIKGGDYSLLRSLVRSQDPLVLAEEALKRCARVIPLDPLPPVYLFVGFFSADGLTVEVEGAPSIALGLERFQDFKDFSLLVSHEYGHCAQRGLLKNIFDQKERNLLLAVLAEGISVLFSESVYPEVPLHRHLFLSPERLQWCRQNQEALLEIAEADLSSEKLIPVLFGAGDPDAGLPPRVGYFIAREMLRHCLSHHRREEFEQTFPGFGELFRQITERSSFGNRE